VLSGFLITTLLVNEWDTSGAISRRGFYRRRALRLFPALAAVLVLGTALALLYHGASRTAMIAFVLFTAGYVANVGVALGAPLYWVFTWSLAAEEQFYLVWPAALIAALRRDVDRRRLAVWLLAAAALSWALSAELQFAGAHGIAFYSPVTRASGILCGCAAGVLFASGRLPQLSPRVGLAGLACYLAAVFTIGPNSPLSVLVAIPVAAVAGTLVVCAATNERGTWLAWLAWRPLAYIGTISYAMYLWNSIIFDNLHGLPRIFGIPLTIAAAAASMWLIERRFLARENRSPLSRTAEKGSIAPTPAGSTAGAG
jgi:peptidoglycan/LPS O-acetylase OafA/YrhL